jgi:beta-glucosidase
MRALARGWMLVTPLLFLVGAEERPLYRDPGQPVDRRVADLITRMTLEEKVAQTLALWWDKAKITGEDGTFSAEKAALAMPHGIGELARPSELRETPQKIRLGPRESANFVNAVQRWLLENTRLGIPALNHEEALHGLTAPRGTHFPSPIALASTWDPGLLERVMSVAALEARTRGIQHVLSPVLDLARDPRWGRTEETYGEDPYLVSRLGVAAIRGYQGASQTLAKDKVYATAKHFAGHGPNEGGINTAPSSIGERVLREQYLLPFEVAVVEAGVMNVMPSYNELDGVPSHKNRWLLERLLRREWGFRGLVVSDYFAIEQMQSRHGVAVDLADAARQALEAGVDLELPDPRRTSSSSSWSVRAGLRRRRSIGRWRACCARSSSPACSRTHTRTRSAPNASATRPSIRRWRSRRRAGRWCCSGTRAGCCRSIGRSSGRSR